MAATGLVFAAGLYCAAGWLVDSGLVRDPRAYYGLVALTPAVFFATILASFRGYFQGYQMMTPPAVSQILEQLVRVVTMVVLAYYCFRTDWNMRRPGLLSVLCRVLLPDLSY